jgi:hypothetical protein
MFVAGIHISNDSVTELASMLRDEYYVKAADTFERALDADAAAVGLTTRERTSILDVLDDPPDGSSSFAAYSCPSMSAGCATDSPNLPRHRSAPTTAPSDQAPSP